MLYAFFESIKYVGHLLPISFLRIYLGYYYLSQALEKYHGDYLIRPKLAAQVGDILPSFIGPTWYKSFLESFLIPNWQAFAIAIVVVQFLVAISYLLGYLVRPMALIASILTLNFIFIAGAENLDLLKTLFAINVVLAWVGAGRCLGLDYYFFKRQRGLWW